MSNYDGSLNFNTKINKQGFDKGVKGISSSLKKLGVLFASVFAVKKLVDFGRAAINTASDLQEVANVVNVTFGKLEEQINEFASTAIEKFGLSELSAKRYASTLGAMGKAMGVNAEQNLEMSKTLTGLIGDYASFYNVSQDRAETALKGIYTGETEALKGFGIVMTQVNLQEFARQQGIQKSIKAMNQQEITMLRYNFILARSADITNDFSRTSDSWANQTRILSERWKQFLGLIGTNLVRVFTPALQILNRLLSTLIAATEQFNKFYAAATGKSADVSSGVTQQIDSSVDSQKQLTEEVENTNKALKGSLAGFDEINVLSTDTGSDLGGGTGGFEPIVPIDNEETEESEGFSSKLLDILKPLQDISFEKLNNSLDNLKKALQPIAENLGEGLVWLYENAFVPLSKFVIEDFLPSFLNLLAEGLTALNEVLEPFKPLGIWLLEEFLLPIIEFAGSTLVDFIDLLVEALIKFTDWASENQELIKNVGASLLIFFGAWELTKVLAFIQVGGGLVKVFLALTTAIVASTTAKISDKVATVALTASYALDFVKSIISTVTNLALQTAAFVKATAAKVSATIAAASLTAGTWLYNAAITAGTVATTAFTAVMAVLTSPITLVVAAIAALIAIVVLLVKNWDTVKEVTKRVWDRTVELWNQFANFIKTKVVDPVKNFFVGLWKSILSIFTTVANAIKDVFLAIFNAIKNVFITIIDFITGLFEGVVNTLLTGINFLIGALNKISFKIPDWIPEFGGKEFGINISKLDKIDIPKLATGTETPVPGATDKLGLTDEEIDRLINAQADRPIEVNLEIVSDSELLSRALRPQLNAEGQRKGNTMVISQ